MAFVGNTELVIFEIGIVGLVGFMMPKFVRVFFPSSVTYDSLVAKISWAPSNWLRMLFLAAVFLVLEPLAVYRIRLLGNWASGVNLGALVVFWVMQVVLALAHGFSANMLWISFILMLIAFALSIATSWTFILLDTFAGVLAIIVSALLVYLTLVSLVVAVTNGSAAAAAMFAKRQATWNGGIGATMPTNRRTAAMSANVSTNKIAFVQRQSNARSADYGTPPSRRVPSLQTV